METTSNPPVRVYSYLEEPKVSSILEPETTPSTVPHRARASGGQLGIRVMSCPSSSNVKMPVRIMSVMKLW